MNRENPQNRESLPDFGENIRSALNNIINLSESVLQGELSPEQRKKLEQIKEAGESILREGKGPQEDKAAVEVNSPSKTLDFSLRGCMNHAVKDYADKAEAKGLALNSLIETDVTDALHGDPGSLRQVIAQFLSNAVNATTKGEVNLRVKEILNTSEEVMLQFSISDTGAGIPPENMTAISAWIQSDESGENIAGNGLISCKKRVKAMKGKIWASSNHGYGSTFHFNIKCAPQKDPAPQPVPLSNKALQGISALIVDTSNHQERLKDLLTGWQIGVDVCLSAEDLKTTLGNTQGSSPHYNIALIEGSPDPANDSNDGFKLASAIRELLGPNVPKIILLTETGKPGDADQCKALGIEAYLSKPVNPDELLSAIKTVLNTQPEEKSPLITKHSLREDAESLQVLLVDDNRMNQKFATRMLKARGCVVTAADNGKKCLEALENGKFNLILMDVEMPEMNGIEATKNIRAFAPDAPNVNIPIFALTGHVSKENEKACLDAGMNGFLQKPINKEKLAEIIQEIQTTGDRSNS
ncbi:MAG: response regulator [Fibrobacteria bacterium]|nr:response regulator [Fibrobacteria bacterium]